MQNKNVGWLIIGIAAVMGIIVLIFDNALRNIIGQTCSHGASCSMYNTVAVQTWLGLSIVAVLFIIGLVIMFVKPHERIVVQKVRVHAKETKKKLNLDGLDAREKEVVKLLQEENGMFQKELMEKIGVGKVGMTRLLDKLESKQLIERKRRGMNNFVVVK